MADSKKQYRFESTAIDTRLNPSGYREFSSPLYLNSGYSFESFEQAKALFRGEEEGHVYARYSNPNTDEFIAKLCALEGCSAGLATASGMAAMFASLAPFLRQGDHLIASRALFGSTHQIIGLILARWGIRHTYVEIDDPEGFARAIEPKTRLIFLETPSNPGLDIFDVRKIARVAHDAGALLVVDNCFATPYLQRPASMGADLVTHSATKMIDGQGRVLGGAILGSDALIEQARFFCRHTGPSMSSFNAWLLSESIETLAVRMERQCDNAQRLAQAIEGHSALSKVRYPFLESHPQYRLARSQMHHGGMLLTIELREGIAGSSRFLNALRLISISANLGDTRSMATHPATTTHSNLPPERQRSVGISPGLIRISIGLEHVDDLIADVGQALDRALG